MAEEDESLQEYLDSAQLSLNEKVDNIVKLDRALANNIISIDNEIKRLSDLKKHYGNIDKKLRNYVSYQMKSNDIDEIKTGIAKLTFRKSTQVKIDDEKKISDEYKKEKVTISVDKMKIKKDLLSGKEVEGAELLTFSNLNIK